MWKGRAASIELAPDGNAASLFQGDGFPFFTVFEPAGYIITEEDGIGVHTVARAGSSIERRYMREGVMAGLERDADSLPGRFIICKAIGLAVHLGVSRITLGDMTGVTPRARRNLESMVRPLKGRRVRVIEPMGVTHLFPEE